MQQSPCLTVHSAKGDEADVVIISLVGSSEPFLTNQAARHLMLVALSRAQQQLVIINNPQIRFNNHLAPLYHYWAEWEL